MSLKTSAFLMIGLLAIVAVGTFWLDAAHSWLAATVAVVIAGLFLWQSWVQVRALKNFEQHFIESSLHDKGQAFAATLNDPDGTQAVMREVVAEATFLQELLEKLPPSDPLVVLLKTNQISFLAEPVVSIPQKKSHFLMLQPSLPFTPTSEVQELLLFRTLQFWRRAQNKYPAVGFIIDFPHVLSIAFCEKLYALMQRIHYPTQQLIFCMDAQDITDFDTRYGHLTHHGVRLILKVRDFQHLQEQVLLPRSLSFLSLPESLIQDVYKHQGLERLRLWQEQGCHIMVTEVRQESILLNLTPITCDYATGPIFGGPHPFDV